MHWMNEQHMAEGRQLVAFANGQLPARTWWRRWTAVVALWTLVVSVSGLGQVVRVKPDRGKRVSRKAAAPRQSNQQSNRARPSHQPGEVKTFGPEIEMVWIPPGEFRMGSEKGDGDEKPVHRVRISRGFWMGRYEVTQRQWERVMGWNPSEFKDCPDCPVENVSWEVCQAFVRRLNEKYPVGGGLEYRLPSEAEWEYACRAGTQGDHYGGDGDERLAALGWYSEGNINWEEDISDNEKTHPVGQKQPNGWGLYDMHGNVSEWCGDWYDERYYARSPVDDPRGPARGEYRVMRGGAWIDKPNFCRATFRFCSSPSDRDNTLGFRLVVGAP